MHANRLTTKPVVEVIAAIKALDLASVKARLTDAERGPGWSAERADAVEGAYKTYLTLVAKYQDEAQHIGLSQDVDEFWHTHILQTRKYAADCNAVFGAFLHHEPQVGEMTEADHRERAARIERSRELYASELGSVADAAFCGVAAEPAAFCGVAKQAAFCGVAKQSAFCGVAATNDAAAFCGVAKQAAFCGVAKQAAFCGVAKQAAFCGVAKQAAFCGVAKQAAFCGVADKATQA